LSTRTVRDVSRPGQQTARPDQLHAIGAGLRHKFLSGLLVIQ
jgi:hypothetical protein